LVGLPRRALCRHRGGLAHRPACALPGPRGSPAGLCLPARPWSGRVWRQGDGQGGVASGAKMLRAAPGDGFMTTLALALVLTAALVHATWNLLAKQADEKLPFLWCAALATTVLYLPLGLWLLLTRPASLLGWGLVVG